MTEHLSTPNFYLDRATTCARNTRAWVHRYATLHPEEKIPGPLDMAPNRVSFVIGVLDELDLTLTRAKESVDHHLPTAATESRRRREETQHSLNLHQLERADTVATEILRWSHTARWSEGVKPADLDQLDLLARKIKENLRHLLAQAQEADLER